MFNYIYVYISVYVTARFLKRASQIRNRPTRFESNTCWAGQFYACAIDATRVSDRYSSSCDE